jgi:DNA-binding transcriptional MerR regulator
VTTSEVATQAQVNIQRLRYYERRGLLPEPAADQLWDRAYTPDAVRVVRFVKRAARDRLRARGRAYLPIRERLLLQLAGMRDFVWLHAGKEQAAESPQAESPVEHAAL